MSKLNIRQRMYAICAKDIITGDTWAVGARNKDEKKFNPPHLSKENVFYWCGTRNKNPFKINHQDALAQANLYLSSIKINIEKFNPNIELFIVNLNSKKCPIFIDEKSLETTDLKFNKTKFKVK